MLKKATQMYLGVFTPIQPDPLGDFTDVISYANVEERAGSFYFLLEKVMPSVQEGQRTYNVADVVYTTDSESHRITEFANFRSLRLCFPAAYFHIVNINEAQCVAATSRNPDIAFQFLQFYRAFARQNPSAAITPQQLNKLVRNYRYIKDNGNWPYWLHLVHEKLSLEWNETLTLQQLSIVSKVNPVTISKAFPSYFSCTLGEYMRKLKIKNALRILQSSSESLTRIAYQCGFADQSHFTRTFKDITGLLPKQYKKF